MEQNLCWETKGLSVSQKAPAFYGIRYYRVHNSAGIIDIINN
jgi:hypothetical protein